MAKDILFHLLYNCPTVIFYNMMSTHSATFAKPILFLLQLLSISQKSTTSESIATLLHQGIIQYIMYDIIFIKGIVSRDGGWGKALQW
jgi:hypothetical protein